jgi:uncharacterized protein YydD (DUF2326 family)
MKLSKLYCNNKDFKNITFNPIGINVIYADVKPIDKSKKDNSHSRGKTKVAELIDFLLLKKIDSKHFLLKNVNEKNKVSIFIDYIFYLEIELNSEQFLTIKRSVNNNTKIAFALNNQKTDSYNPPQNFEDNIPIDKAKLILSNYLNFDFFFGKKYDYRKALSYILRTPPDDYKNVYQLSNFYRHKDWKPFIFDLLGFDGELLSKKYENDEEIQEINGFIQTLKKEYNIEKKNRDNLVGEKISIEENIQNIQKKVDSFNFYEQDKKLIENGINLIEGEISNFNSISYNINYEIDRLKKSIQNEFAFDIKKVNKVFEESQIYFGEQIKNDYQNLLDFNKKITSERNKLVQKVLKSKQVELNKINNSLQELNSKKENLLSVIQDTDIFKKFKTHQKILAKSEEELIEVNEKIKSIDLIFSKENEIEIKEDNIKETVNKIKELLLTTQDNKKYKDIRTKFNHYFNHILNDEEAQISWHINKEGNVDFPSPKVFDKATKNKETAKDEGTTYKKMLCVAFDLSILSSYNNQSYFRFVFHDDVLSQQDNGIKIRLLELINKICSEYKLQYLLTVIKSDLPSNDVNDEIIYFKKNEIILELNDLNEKGTLFGFEF